MTYYISRNEQKYGPYSLANLQRYVGTGEILPTDLAQSEGMQGWVPVSQIIGNIAVATPAPQAPLSYGQVPAYGMSGATGDPAWAAQYPAPPNLHWALVLLLGVVTCGVFLWVWMFVEAAYVSKIHRENKSMILYAIGVPGLLIGSVLQNVKDLGDAKALGSLIYLVCIVVTIVGHYKIKASLEQHFTSAEPVNLQLSGVMTFFFNVIYFQYHFNQINNWRKTGVLR